MTTLAFDGRLGTTVEVDSLPRDARPRPIYPALPLMLLRDEHPKSTPVEAAMRAILRLFEKE